jgi:hypothetical protein
MDVEYCTTGPTVKIDNSLVLVQQNVKGMVSRTRDIIVSFRTDKINPQVLCFTEHHMLHGNLCLTNIENYESRSNFSRRSHQKGGVKIFIRKDNHFSSLDLSTVMKNLMNSVLYNLDLWVNSELLCVFIEHHQGSIINFKNCLI